MGTNHAWQVVDWIAADGFSRLGVALGHFLWQGCVVALLYAAASRLLRGTSANTRYMVGVTALLLMAGCLPVTLVMIPPSQTVEEHDGDSPGPVAIVEEPSEPIREIATAAAPLLESTGPAPIRPLPSLAPTKSTEAVPVTPVPVVPASEPPKEVPSPGILARLLPWASILYLCGVFTMLIRVALGLWGGRRLRRDSSPVAETAILDLLGEHARRMGMRAAPVIAACGRVSVPLVVGIFRPMILVPTSLISGLTPGELEAVLVHELAHIRRFDPVVNVLQRLVEAVLFFHPAVWWVSRCVSVERENACDDLVLRTNCGRNEYASALVHMAELCVAGGSPAMIRSSALAATGKGGVQFRRRVLRVLKQEERVPVRLTAPGIVVSMLLIVALMLAPAAWRGMAWAEAEVEEKTPDPLNSPEEHEPVSMSAEEFARLSAEEQKALLVRVFERRLEHARNLHYVAELFQKVYENRDGKPGKPLDYPDAYPLGLRRVCCYWRLGDSFRREMETYNRPTNVEPDSRDSCGVDVEEGLGRNTYFSKQRKTSQGQVQYPQKLIAYHGYDYWVNTMPDDCNNPVSHGRYLFSDLLKFQDDYEIEMPAEGGFVRLSVPWELAHEKTPGGKRVYLLDPRKGFLPVRCDASYAKRSSNGRTFRGEETFVVDESRLVNDVWMPVKLTETSTWSGSLHRINVNKTTISRIEHGSVGRADLHVPFSEGMRIQDTVEGATYTVNAQGRPGPDLKLDPGWKQKTPKGWKQGEPFGDSSMASNFAPADREKLAAAQSKIDDKRARMEESLKVLQSGSTVALEDRVEAGLEILREYEVFENEVIWAAAVRELIQIGKPAVPKLTEELDRTERNASLRALGFIFRGIDDPRAVPALIRAIPRTLQGACSDCGMLINDDSELADFMAKHDNEAGEGSGNGRFSYGVPMREILPALEKLAGHEIPRNDIRFVTLEGGPKQRQAKRALFLKLAKQWADWWSKHWRDVVENEDEAQLELIEKSLGRYAEMIARESKKTAPAEFPRGPNVVVSDGTMDSLIRSFKERPEGGFLDFDSGRKPRPSKLLIDASAEDKPSKELLDWAEKDGVDLITVKIKTPDGDGWYYAFWPVGMKVWRIDESRYDGVVKELRQDTSFELPKPWQGPLALIDEETGKYEKKSTASYLFITKEGTCGRLQLKGPLYQKYIPGSACMSGGGMGYDFLYEGESETGEEARPEAEKKTPDPLNSSAEPATAKTVHGKVVDEEGTSIPGADVWMMPVYDPVKENPAAHVTTDAQGRFTLAVHAPSDRDLKRGGWPYRPDLVLAYADGRRLAMGEAYEQMAGRDKSDVVIRLKPAAETEFVVLGPDGKPKVGAVIEPRYLRNPHLELPREIRARVAARTDAEGRAVLTAVPRDAINFIDVATDDLGVQRQHLIPKGGGGIKDGEGGMAFPVGLHAGQPIRLRQGGTVVGRITAEKPEWTRGVRIMVTTGSLYAPARSTTGSPVAPDRFKDTGISTTQGFADVVSDEDGRFEIPVIAAGSMIVNAFVADQLPVLPVEPGRSASLRSRPGETVEVEIPLVRTIPAVGSVRIKKSGQPIPRAVIQINCGTDLMQNIFVMTDTEGNYASSVLPGMNRAAILGLPAGYHHLDCGKGVQCEVPEDAEEFRIPVLEVGGKGPAGDVLDSPREQIEKGMMLDALQRKERFGQHPDFMNRDKAELEPVPGPAREWVPTTPAEDALKKLLP